MPIHPDKNFVAIAGVDEVGRGCLAGAVVAAAIILNPDKPISGLKDSKKLTSKQRQQLDIIIRNEAVAFAIGRAEVIEIDTINILQASLLAMSRAVMALSCTPELILVDGIHCPQWLYPSETIIRGDEKVAVIAAASIIAKVYRDNEMIDYHAEFPQYGFAQHKGYGTKQHIKAIKQHGICRLHRRSFKPISIMKDMA